jgi:hypothetical protein
MTAYGQSSFINLVKHFVVKIYGITPENPANIFFPIYIGLLVFCKITLSSNT